MMKLKLTFFLFTFFLLGAIAPKALLELSSAEKDLTLKLQTITIHAPKIKKNGTQDFQAQGMTKLSARLTQKYQEALYAQWMASDTSVSVTETKAKTSTTKKPEVENDRVVYDSAPTYKYREVSSSKGEINNKELVKHFGFQLEAPEVAQWSANYDSKKVAAQLDQLKVHEEKRLLAQATQKTDQVELKQASVSEAKPQSLPLEENEYSQKEMDDETWEEELVMIDYSDEGSEDEAVANESTENQLTTQQAMQLLAEGSPQRAGPKAQADDQKENIVSMTDDLTNDQDISASVMSAISREMDKRESIPTVATVNTQKHEYTKKTRPTETKRSLSSQENDEYSSRETAGRSVNKMSIHEVLLGQKNEMRELRNFEFFAETLYGESYVDDANGEISLDFNLNSSLGVLRGTILKHGYMRTKVDLVMEPGEYNLQIPLIEQDTFSRFLDEEEIFGRGGFILVRLPRRADNVEIDAQYEAKILLDEKLNVVDEDDYFEYVLFAAVDPGNVLISYKNISEKVADKITHVVEDEVLFESGLMIDAEQLHFTLEEKNMLSRKNSSVDIHPDQINYFNRRTQASQQAVSSYSIQTPLRSLGMRDYLEMRHTQLPMFVGLWSNKKVELPSENFAYYIMDSHQLNSLQNACMVQINLSRPLKEANFFGETKRGPMGIVQSYLDVDGEFNYDPSEMATHIFLVGDLQGTISGKLEYADGSYDFIQTFCSNNTYLVEQL